MRTDRLLVLTIGFTLLSGCAATQEQPTSGPENPCNNADGALSNASFVLVSKPDIGTRVNSGFNVTGCSRTFESHLNWRLLARDGTVLAESFTNGGGVDGFGPFEFNVEFTATTRQFGHLEVFEEDASDGEGFPPGRNVLPLILLP